jgi:hypothetical protein
MLTQLEPRQARLIAEYAQTARDARDALLHGVSDETVDEPHPARGEHDRIGAGGFDVLPASDTAVTALRGAIGELGPGARSELFALMRIGQGELAAADFERGLTEAAAIGDEGVSGILADDIDLPSHLAKGLYEVGAA